MIFIDWISTKDHASFNSSLFSSLKLSKCRFYVFSETLRIEGLDNIVMECNGGRLTRALKVYKICWRNRNNPIFLVTYDPVVFPLLQLFCREIFVYEHNTTPETGGFSKHAIWQRLFFWKVVRFAQFPGQERELKKLGQICFFLGSPLMKSISNIVRKKPSVYIAPSGRMQVDELFKMRKFMGNSEVVIRRSSCSDEQLDDLKKQVNVTPQEWIDLDEYLPKTKAIIITISSRIRGSGWFNEAIKFGIPLIITNPDMQKLFENTFPAFPYIRLDQVESVEDLEEQLIQINRFSGEMYIKDYNERIRQRYDEVVNLRHV